MALERRRARHRASPSAREATVLEAARSQIAGTVSQAEVADLPLNGRNFLDLALLVPGVSPTNVGSTQLFAETSAVPGRRPLGRQPAQPLEQLHRRRPVGQRRCGGAERHSVRRRRGRSVPGGDVGRAGGARARARRLRQRRHEERHEHDCAAISTATSATIASTPPNALSGTKLPMNQQQYGGSLGGPIARDRTFYLRERRAAAASIRPAWSTISRRRPSRAINARLAAVGYPGPPVTTGIYPNPVDSTQLSRQGRSPGQRQRSVQRPLQPLRRRRRSNSRGAGGAERAERVVRRSTTSIRRSRSATRWTLSPRTVNETRAQFAHGDLKAPPTDPIGPAVSIAGVASFGTLVEQPDTAASTRCTRSSTTCRTRPARTRCAPASTSSTTTTPSPSRDRSAAATRSRRSRTSWPAPTTTPASRRRSATTVVVADQSERRHLRAGRVEGRAQR